MRYLDVCSGYSAATIAFEPLGWECAGYAEVDPFPAAILAARRGATMPIHMLDPLEADIKLKERRERERRIKALPNYHWGDTIPNFGDFRKIEAKDVGPIQLLIGGTPCQSFSQAGKRLGLADPRGNLTLEFLALAGRTRPTWLVWENVPGFLSHDNGRTMGIFLWHLGQLGYGFSWRVLDVQYVTVDGFERAIPQRRKRLFLVGHLGSGAAAASVLFDRESLRGNPRPRRRASQDVAGTIRASAGKRGGIQDQDGHSGLVAARLVSFGEYAVDGTASPVLARDHKDASDLIVFDETQITNPNNRSNPQPDDACHTISAESRPPTIAFPEYLGADACASTENVSCALGAKNPTAICIHTDAIGRDGKAKQPSEDARGVERARDAGMGVIDDGSAYSLNAGHQPHAIALQERGREGGRNLEYQEEVAYALNAPDKGGRRNEMVVAAPDAVAFKSSHFTRDKDGAPAAVAPPLTADTDKGDQDTLVLASEPDVADQNWKVRRLTPPECERLMGVPTGFTHIIMKRRQRSTIAPDLEAYWQHHHPDLSHEEMLFLCTDSPRYKALGNSMGVNVIRWLGRGIDEVARILGEI